MKIGQPSDHSIATAQNNQPAATKAASQEAAQAARAERKAPAAGVTVTKTVGGLDKPSAASEVDSEKVKAVRQAIADGTYSVNAEAIADKLLASAREMLQRTSN